MQNVGHLPQELSRGIVTCEEESEAETDWKHNVCTA